MSSRSSHSTKRLWASLPVRRGPKSTIRCTSARTCAGEGSGTVVLDAAPAAAARTSSSCDASAIEPAPYAARPSNALLVNASPCTGTRFCPKAATDAPSRASRPLHRRRRAHQDRNPLHLVVRVPTEVPCGLERLDVAGAVRRPAAELVLARLGDVPVPLPETPSPRPTLRAEPSVVPALPAVDAHLDALDRSEARPGAAANRAPTRLEDALARREVGHSRRDHQRARHHPRHGLALLVLRLADPVAASLLVAAERAVDDFDAVQPLDARHPVPAGDDEPKREAVLRRERLPVHLVRQQHLLAERRVQRKAALVHLPLATLDAAVESAKHDLTCAVAHSGFVEQRPERHPGPVGGPDGFDQPGLAQRSWRQLGAAVSGALERHANRGRLAGAQLGERERQLATHLAPDLEPPRIGVDD